jgi:hypothetical protein
MSNCLPGSLLEARNGKIDVWQFGQRGVNFVENKPRLLSIRRSERAEGLSVQAPRLRRRFKPQSTKACVAWSGGYFSSV